MDARERLDLLRHACDLQAEDRNIWDPPKDWQANYLQEALRNLHSMIEDDDPTIALEFIQEASGSWSK